jgi:starch-binding outer membrane protein, SusD/RagB family
MIAMNRFAARVLAPAAALMVGAAACADLDETPQTFLSPETFFTSDANVRTAAAGMYVPLTNGWGWSTTWSTWCDDNEMYCWNWMSGGFRGLLNAGPEGSEAYIHDYRVVARANDLLSNLPGASGVTAAAKKQAAGEAYFIRGYAYFDLARRYGMVPLRLTPYQSDPTLGDIPRTALPDVYAAIVADLKAAADSLPASYGGPNGGLRPTKVSAFGLLAKVYMEMAGAQMDTTALNGREAEFHGLALGAAKAAMDLAPTAGVALNADYMKSFDTRSQDTDAEILFALNMGNKSDQTSPVGQYFSPIGDPRVAGRGQGFLLIRQDFLQSFESADKRAEPNKAVAWSWTEQNGPRGPRLALYEDSLRKLVDAGLVATKPGGTTPDTVAINANGWSEGCGSFMHPTSKIVWASGKVDTIGISKGTYTLKYLDPVNAGTSNSNTNNIIILRYADVVLLRAEAENEVNGPAAALPFIDMVRTRAGLQSLATANPGAMASKATFRQAVWTERAHELYAEFQATWDLKREGRWLAVQNANQVLPAHKKTGYWGHDLTAYPCRPRSNYQLWQPLPQAEIAANQLLQQNPGW